MQTFETIEEVADVIKFKLSNTAKKRIFLLYAFNGTGKTRLSRIIKNELDPEDNDLDSIKVLGYNAIFEDIFTWNNEECVLNFNPNNYIIKLISEQGLEYKITDTFQKLTQSKIFPLFDFYDGIITFNLPSNSGQDDGNIKISRGEESMFVWSVFSTVMEIAISVLNTENVNDRETELFDDLEYIIIDDPVSSIDDTKIIFMAIELVNLLKSNKNKGLKFLITTHHPLFFNILHEELKKTAEQNFLLSKNILGFNLDEQGNSPFAYHLTIINEIKDAIDSKELKKYHFNLFRGVLEKTSGFLGYEYWSDCLEEDNKKEIMRLINLYSHGRLSDLESAIISEDENDLFRQVFNVFLKKYKWGV